jgi:hypothetical protein
MSTEDFYGDDTASFHTPSSSESNSKRNSFFAALPNDGRAPEVPLKTSALPKLDTTTSQEGADRLPRGARLAHNSSHATLPPHSADPPTRRPNRSSFFGMHEEPAARERTRSNPVNEPHPPSGLGRPSSFYGLEGHMQPHGPRRRSSFTHAQPGSWPRRETADRRSGGMASFPSASPSSGGLDGTSPVPGISRLDHSHLQVGAKASLLSHAKTLDLYRANAKKTTDPEVTFEFATFMLSIAQEIGDDEDEPAADGQHLDPAKARRGSLQLARKSPSSSSSSIFRASSHSDALEAGASSATSSETDLPINKRNNLLREVAGLLRRLANQGHVPSQYLLADLHAQGTFSAKGKPEWDKAFPLFVLAAKHGHTDAAFRTAQCCEHAMGCRRDAAKAVQWYKWVVCAASAAALITAVRAPTEKPAPTRTRKRCSAWAWPRSTAS